MHKTTNPTTTCLKSNLQKALALVGRAVAKNSTLPILTNVLLSSESGRLRLSGTTLELSLTTHIGCKSSGDWKMTLPFQTLSDYVAALPDDTVTLECNATKSTVKATCQTYTSTFKGLAADEFPALPAVDKPAFSLDGQDITSAIKRVIGAAATDEARPMLTGILMRSVGGQVVLVASDGFRVAEARLAEKKAPAMNVIVPAKGLGELPKCLADEQPVDVQLYGAKDKPDRIGFRCGETELVAQLLEGAFPAYENVIPKKIATEAVIETARLRQACKVADIFARENAHTVRIKVRRPSGDDKKNPYPAGMELSTTAAETGDHNSFIDGQVHGPELEIAFNVKFLKEAVDICDQPNTQIRFVDATSPAIIRPATGEDYLVVLMPMHLGK